MSILLSDCWRSPRRGLWPLFQRLPCSAICTKTQGRVRARGPPCHHIHIGSVHGWWPDLAGAGPATPSLSRGGHYRMGYACIWNHDHLRRCYGVHPRFIPFCPCRGLRLGQYLSSNWWFQCWLFPATLGVQSRIRWKFWDAGCDCGFEYDYCRYCTSVWPYPPLKGRPGQVKMENQGKVGQTWYGKVG